MMKTLCLPSILPIAALVLTSLNTEAAELKQFHHRLLMSSPRATANSLAQQSGLSPPPPPLIGFRLTSPRHTQH